MSSSVSAWRWALARLRMSDSAACSALRRRSWVTGSALAAGVGAGFAEWIGPEKIVAGVVQLHSGEKRVGTIEILDHVGKSSVVIVAVESPVIAVLEIVDAGFAGLPTGGCAKDQSGPGHINEGFAVVVPGGVEHAHGLMLLAVANKVPDVHETRCRGPARSRASCLLRGRRPRAGRRRCKA